MLRVFFSKKSIIPKRAKYSKVIMVFACIVLSLVSALICFCDVNVPESYVNMFLLPLGHCLIMVFVLYFVLKGDIYNDMPILILLLTLTIRNVVTPMVMVLEKYESRFGIGNSKEYIDIAVFAFLFETVSVFITVVMFQKKKSNPKKRLFRPLSFKDNTIFYGVLFGGLALSIMFFVLLPDLKTQYYTIFADDISSLEHEVIKYSGIKKALQTASGMIIEAVRLTLASWLIVCFRKKGENMINYLLSICVILVQFLFMNDSNAYVIMIALALYLLIYKLYPTYSLRTIKYLILVVGLFGFLMYVNRFSQDIYGTSLSLFLQAYFPGLANFAVIERLMDRSTLDAIEQVFIDLYAAVPFRSTLFGYRGGLVDLSTMWNLSNGITGQILPSSAQSYYYFGLLGSPLVSIILTWISLSMFEKANKTKNPFMFSAMMFMVIYSSTSVSMYNFLIFSGCLTTRIAFMLLFSCFSTETFDNVLRIPDTNSFEKEKF